MDLGMRANVLILGVTYRQGVKETYLSGALKLRDILKAKGHHVFGLDPLLSDGELSQMGFETGLIETEIDVIILQNSDELFLDMSFQAFTNCKIIFDGRKFLDPIVFGDLKIKYLSI
jgi:UDP-N-acetyl-D-mannosaminuronate dehydrogenase